MTELHYSVIWLGTFTMIASITIFLLFYSRLNERHYFKFFYIQPLISLFLSFNTILNRIYNLYSDKTSYLLQSLLIALDFLFWAIFFIKILEQPLNKKSIKTFFVAAIVISLLSYSFNDLSKSNLHSVAIFNIFKSIFCILYYHQLFKNSPVENLRQEPLFWIITGLFFYSCVSIPFYALNDYLRHNTPTIINTNIFAISNILIIIMHAFFIKAYLCQIRHIKG